MKRLMIMLILGAIAFTSVAQEQIDVRKRGAVDLSFRCQIEGRDVILPCQWSDLERQGWHFSNAQDSVRVLQPTCHSILLEHDDISVLSPENRQALMSFCNVSDKEVPCSKSMVWGIVYTPDRNKDVITVYDFKLAGGITGVSTQNDLMAAYGPSPDMIAHYGVLSRLSYPNLKYLSDDWLDIYLTDYKEGVSGKVVGFGATARKATERLIAESDIAISEEQAREVQDRRATEQRIANLTEELQLAEADSLKNNAIHISQLKYVLAELYGHCNDYNKAFELMLQSAQTGYCEAQRVVGIHYFYGQGVEQDYRSAVLWFEKAAEQDDANAIHSLGSCYYNGYGVEQNHNKAFQLWLKAAQGGYEPIFLTIADAYYHGAYGVKRNYKEAFFWYEKAAKAGSETAVYNMSILYHKGQGVKRDYNQAFELLMQSDIDQYYSQQALSEHYFYGRGVEKDIAQAIIHAQTFLELIEKESTEIRNLYAKEIKIARKMIKNHRVVQ